ncbi:MAG: MFS transporter [Firmicutes bacterium]|nr:MFS transporter [Bacillota bacterium]
MNGEPLTKKDMFFYSVGGIAQAGSSCLVSSFLLFFFTSIAGIRPAAAGTIVGVGTIISAAWNPVVGFLSDHAVTAKGRRRLFLLLAMLPLAVSTVLCFTVVQGSDGFRILYYSLLVVICKASEATYYSPWLALGSTYTSDYDQRLELRQITYVVTQFGCVAGSSLPLVAVDRMQKALGLTEARAWQLMALAISAAGLVCILITYFNAKDRDPSTADLPKTPFRLKAMLSDYIDILKLKPMRHALLASFFFVVVQGIFGAARVYYLNYNLMLSSAGCSFVILMATVFSIEASVPVTALSKKGDKKNVIAGFMAVNAVGFFILMFLKDSIASALVITFLFAHGSTTFWQLFAAINYDICEYDEYRNGVRRDGVVSSFSNLFNTVCAGLASLLLGWILQLSGFVEGQQVQSASAQMGIKASMLLLPAGMLLISAFLYYRFPLDRKTVEHIVAELKQKDS